MIEFHLPTKPVTLIQKINRVAAATGSPRNAQLTRTADYNGHAITATFNEYRKYYVAEYYWGERVVVARGDCRRVVSAAVREYQSGGAAASLRVRVRAEDVDQIADLGLGACRETPRKPVKRGVRGRRYLGRAARTGRYGLTFPRIRPRSAPSVAARSTRLGTVFPPRGLYL